MARKIIAIFVLAVLVLGNVAAGEEKGIVSDDYNRKIEEFFAKIKEGKVEDAVDFIYSENPWIIQNIDAVQNLKNQMMGLDKMIGKYQAHEKLIEKKVADRFVYLYYFVAYERQPVRFIFEYYKAADRWTIYSFSFDADLVEEIEDLAKKDLLSK